MQIIELFEHRSLGKWPTVNPLTRPDHANTNRMIAVVSYTADVTGNLIVSRTGASVIISLETRTE